MRVWSLGIDDPYSLTLAADARLCIPDYCNDHAWEISLGGGDLPALAIQTTYGLRARMMRLFFRFGQGNMMVSDPAAFSQPPRLQQFFPNFARLGFSPFSGIDVVCEFWVPESQVLAGRLSLVNNSVIPRQIWVECAALLTPLENGRSMCPVDESQFTCLAGATEGITPVLFTPGKPKISQSPYPSLSIDLDLLPGNSDIITWALASLPDLSLSIDQARLAASRAWDAEVSRIEMQNSQQIIEIETGNPAWDAALAFSQKAALSLFLGPTSLLNHPSFVLNRLPDEGYSRRLDGSDYDHLWNGQSVLETYYLSSLILPGAPALAQGLVRNFLSTQTEEGFIDGKPGLGGQRGRFLAAPMLASLAWRIFQISQDKVFLADIFPALLKFCHAWFESDHDRDGDGFPEWDHPLQTGFDDHPIFDRWHLWSQAADITTVESPALGALLVREIASLSQIARVIGQESEIHSMTSRSTFLRKSVETCWDLKPHTYLYRDRDTHLSLSGETLAATTGNGDIVLDRGFPQPQRLVIMVRAHDELTRMSSITIHGRTPSGAQTETIPARSFIWIQGRACLTSRNTFTHLDHVSLKGLSPQDEVTLRTLDLRQQDITLLLPLWAQIPSTQRVRSLVKNQFHPGAAYFRLFGLPGCPERQPGSSPGNCPEVYLPWNQLIIEGLLAYGYRQEASGLVSKIMDVVARSLQQHKAFYRHYHSTSGEVSGERNSLGGLAPVGLFLDSIGVRLLSSTSVIISGFSPYSRPVTIKYRGLSVIREQKHTHVIFPDGQTTNITGSGTHLVSLV